MKKHIVWHTLSFCMIFMFLCLAINCIAAKRDNDGTQAGSVNITPGFLPSKAIPKAEEIGYTPQAASGMTQTSNAAT